MGEKRKILIIEDEEDLTLLLKFNLENTGKYAVSIAYDGEDGLRKAKQESPHLVILDLRLPKLTGEEVCREIRRDEKIGRVPIIMVTGKSSPADRIIGKVIGANSYIPKPFKIEQLIVEIDNLTNPV
ncbi:MAG: response regulator [Candidatus Omnitrophica bacterium]|nr:response regulator [Candidatus Omnitrophota bacterium]MBU1852883.1 response regulator [Candidatus Omnitrophota bacterium]